MLSLVFQQDLVIFQRPVNKQLAILLGSFMTNMKRRCIAQAITPRFDDSEIVKVNYFSFPNRRTSRQYRGLDLLELQD